MANFLTGTTLGVEKAVVTDQSIQLIADFFKLSILPPFLPWWSGFSILIIFITWLAFLIRKKHYNFTFILLSLLLYGVIALLIHKNPPFHYFVPIVILPIILMGRLMSLISQHSKLKGTFVALVALITLLNMRFVFSSSYLTATKADSFSKQLMISQIIYQDAQGEPFSLQRIGPFDQYHNQFKENYDYLLWWLGNAPVTEGTVQYVIVEDMRRKPHQESYIPLATVEDILIMKSKEKKHFAAKFNSFRY